MDNGKKAMIAGGVVFAAILGLLVMKGGKKAPPPPPPPVEQPAPPPAPMPPAPPPEPAVVLPPLEKSDDFLREQLGKLSPEKSLADWLKTEDMVRRITAALEVMSAGKLPKDSLSFLVPKKKFSIVKSGGKILLDPKSYTRYDGAGAVADSINAQAAAKFFKTAKPLFDQACQELGKRTCDIKDTIAKDLKLLLDVPQVEGMVPLRMKIVTWEMTDPKLESLSPPQKMLIRMGPKNSAKVQGKLREFAKAIGIAESELPQPQPYSVKLK